MPFTGLFISTAPVIIQREIGKIMLETIRQNWQKIKENIRDEYEITNVPYSTWIEPLQIYNVRDNTAYIVFPDSKDDFALKYISKKYRLFFQAMIEEVTGYHLAVSFISEPQENPGVIFARERPRPTADPYRSAVETAKLNPRYTFDTFVVGANNKFAHAASLSGAESPGKEYNPLFIYGGPGLGKTHLMQAIAHFILQNKPSTRIIYATSEVFTNEVIDSIRNKNPGEFRNKYRNIDVILIDDIQFIIGKESTQEEFFHTFNFLYENGKQIILSSDQPPKNFTTLDERLRSRFEMGLSVDISAPDYETRMAILRKKEELEGFTIDNEIIKYIATNIKTNIRELEGALTKMFAYSKLHPQSTLTLEIARENLKDIISPDSSEKITPDHIIQVVAEHYGLRPEDIKSQRRTKEVVLPRQIAMYLIRIMNDISLKDVGRILGNRDHATIIHGYEKIINEMNQNPDLAQNIEVIKKKLLL